MFYVDVHPLDNASQSLDSLRSDSINIEQVTLERTRCRGKCPVFTISFFSNGKVEYLGKQNVERLGSHSGFIIPSNFKRLAYLIHKLDFFKLEDRYQRAVTDQAALILRVTMGGNTKSVLVYGDDGPPEFWAIQICIESCSSAVEWK